MCIRDSYNSEHLKVVWEDLVAAAGVDILLHCAIQDARVRDGRLDRVLVATRSGLATASARVVVDATGDADVCAFAGWGYEQAGELAPAQTLTTTFRMVGVDAQQRGTIGKDRLHELMREAAEDGYDLPRREGSDHITPIPGMTAT